MDLIQLLKEHKKDILQHRVENDIRCRNCKTFLRYIKDDWKDREVCKTCTTSTQLEREIRRDLYVKNEQGKWVKKKEN